MKLGKENVRKGMARNTEVVRVTRSQNEKMKNVTSKAQRVADAAKRVGDAIKRKVLGDEYAPVTEGVMALMREKEELQELMLKKKPKPSVSTYIRQKDAGREGRKLLKYKNYR